MDDIVTKLRIQAEVVNSKDHHTISGGLHLDAADEIERLRELADNLYKTLLYYPCQCGLSKCKCGYDDMMDEYNEVRGE